MNDLETLSVCLKATKNDHLTVGVFRWVLDRTMSKKSAAVGTGAIAFNPLVDIVDEYEGAEYDGGDDEDEIETVADLEEEK